MGFIIDAKKAHSLHPAQSKPLLFRVSLGLVKRSLISVDPELFCGSGSLVLQVCRWAPRGQYRVESHPSSGIPLYIRGPESPAFKITKFILYMS